MIPQDKLELKIQEFALPISINKSRLMAHSLKLAQETNSMDTTITYVVQRLLAQIKLD